VLLRTLITHDNGNNWKRLIPPQTDSTGHPIICTGLCSLNLFGLTTWLGVGNLGFYGDIYTQFNAVGLVLATGNYGSYLWFEPTDVQTYMSRDGGQTWYELFKFSSVYAYADHGGIIVVVQNQGPTNVFRYSLDEGLTWITTNFTSSNTTSVNSIMSVSPTGNKFVMKAFTGSQLVYYGLDFSGVFERPCTDNDYETWGLEGGSCVMGRKIVYLRRKQTVGCYNPQYKSPISSQTNCACTVADYECDYNYFKLLNGQCAGAPPDPSTICQPGQSHYNKTQGYRKVPGDSCVNGLAQYEPVLTECPVRPSTTSSTSTSSSSTTTTTGGSERSGLSEGATAGLSIVLILVISATAFWFGIVAAFKSPRLRALLPTSWISSMGESSRLL